MPERLSQENLGKMTEEQRKALSGRKAIDHSEMNLGEVTIKIVRGNSNGYSVTFSPSRGFGEYTYLSQKTRDLELV